MTTDTSPAGAATLAAALSSTTVLERALATAWQRAVARQQQAGHTQGARAATTSTPTASHLAVIEGGSAVRIVSPFEYESIA